MGHFPNRSHQGLCPPCERAEVTGRGDHRGLVYRQGRYFPGSISGASQNQRPEPIQERGQEPAAAWRPRTQADPPVGQPAASPGPSCEATGTLQPSLGRLRSVSSHRTMASWSPTSEASAGQKQPVPDASGLDTAGERPGALSCRRSLGYQESRAGGRRVPSVQLESPQA